MKWLKILVITALGLGLVPAFAFAQTSAPSAGSASASSGCVNLTTNLQFGSTDPQVVVLQNFLIGQGYAISSASGYFGNETLAAVKQFQTDNNISPVSGYVGPVTRAEIQTLSCTGSSESIQNQSTQTQQSAAVIPGDMNGDGIVNATDMTLFNQIPAGAKRGSVSYNPKADLNNDGVVDFKDLLILSQHYTPTPASQTGRGSATSQSNTSQIDNTASVLKAFQNFFYKNTQ